MPRVRSRYRFRDKPHRVRQVALRAILPCALAGVALWAFSGIFDDTASIPKSPPTALTMPDAAAMPAPARRRTSEAELDAALAETLAESDGVRSRTVITRHGILVAVSAELPENANGFGDFVNIRMIVRPSPDGLRVVRMAVGRYDVPSGLIARTLRWSKDLLPGADEAVALLASIESVDPVTKTVTLAAPSPDEIIDVQGSGPAG